MNARGMRQAVAEVLGMTEGMEDGFLDAIVSSLAFQALAVGSTLVNQSDAVDSLWIVGAGQLVGRGGLANQEVELGLFGPGQMLAASLLPASGPSLLTVTAATDAVLWRLSLAGADTLREAWPGQMSAVWDQATAQATFLSLVLGLRQSILFAEVDLTTAAELARMAKQLVLRRGDVLCRQDDPSDAIYLVINGRLDTVKRLPDGTLEPLAEIGPGESVGEIGCVTGQLWPADTVARRDTTVARLTKTGYLELLRRHPQEIARGLVRSAQGVSMGMARFRGHHGGNLPSLALIAAHPGLSLRQSADALAGALARRGSIIVLNSDICTEAGYPINDESRYSHERNIALLRWIGDLERHFSCVLYVADERDSPWTRLCARQADNLLLMIDGSASPQVGPIERSVQEIGAATNRPLTILLVQPPNLAVPSDTAKHLALRQADQHMHVRTGNAADWARVARFLAGHAVGVVFGGGGARGFAHIGILRALEQHGVPVDFVGGASMGALVASQYALNRGADEILDGIMALVRRGEQFTPPLVSLMAGRRFSRGMHTLLGDAAIEDTWRKFFCISANLTKAQPVVHTDGSLWRATLASNSPPGLFPPVVSGGDLLADGGLIDGLPIATMYQHNRKGLLIVINVTPDGGISTSYSYDYGLSGWRILWNRLNSLAVRQVGMPSIVEILVRSMSVGSLANRALMPKRATDLLLEPPLKAYSVMDHAKGAEIAEKGYSYAQDMIGNWWANQLKL